MFFLKYNLSRSISGRDAKIMKICVSALNDILLFVFAYIATIGKIIKNAV